MLISCDYCKKEFNKKPSQIKMYKTHYCSNDCYNKNKVKSVKVYCSTCNQEIIKMPSDIKKSKTGDLFCSHSCSAKKTNITRSLYKSAYRSKAFRELPNHCEICGYNKLINILQVHHKDRDRTNNDINNLQILCPTCHHENHFEQKDGMYASLKCN